MNDWTKQELVDLITAHEHTAYIHEHTGYIYAKAIGDIRTTIWTDPSFATVYEWLGY